jgi:outer membrane protein OmpA-like peptidoglycan-associated protein
VWQSLALSSIGLQPKLAVSQPDDPHEREADRIAETVMRMAALPTATPFSVSHHRSGEAQRKCASCEEEEKQEIQRKEHSAAADPPAVSTLVVDGALSSPGRPLDEATRSFMEPRFGYDFSHVRVHDDSSSATSAAAVNANAYTIGPHIVFGTGRYQPRSNDGRRLLAHELAHTVQQASSPPQVQRNISDFRVTQLQPEPEKRTKGIDDRFFFEFDQFELREDVPEEKEERARLIRWAKANKGKRVKLVGRASQEGSRSRNRNLAEARAKTVEAILEKHDVKVYDRDVDMKFEKRPVEYRFYRSVEVIIGEKKCDAAKDLAECEKAFTAAYGRATAIVKSAMARIVPDTEPAPATQPDQNAPPRQSRDQVLSDRFPGIPRNKLLPMFKSIADRLDAVGKADGHTCNSTCEKDCERAASAGAGDAINLCGAFYNPKVAQGLSEEIRVFAVIHETVHSAVDPNTKSGDPKSVGIDFAYSTKRMFGVLEGSEAFHNADSYVITFLTMAEGTEKAPAILTERGKAPADKRLLTTPAGEKVDRNLSARRAIGFAESWVNYASFWGNDAYNFVAASLTRWRDDLKGGSGHGLVEVWAAPFHLNHPGNAGFNADKTTRVQDFKTKLAGRGFTEPPAASHATTDDRTEIAGIYDRYKRMLELLDNALTIDRAASGDGSWSKAKGYPGLGTDVQLADSFFALKNEEQSRHIIRLMARAMSDIPGAWVEAYVEGADGVRHFRGLGP